MSFIKKGFSALGKLLTVMVLAAAFCAGAVFVVYRSLQGEEVKVPEVVGKNFVETERELEALGLKVKKRADRYSEEQPDTILEQLPRPGETVKTGQLILVVTAKKNPDGEEKPATLQKGNQPVQDDTEKIEELISDKPKKKTNANTNANTNKKKSSTTRDVIGDNSNSNSNTAGNDNKSGTDAANKEKKDDKKDDATPKPNPPANTAKPPASKTPATSGDTRPRRNP